ncbi:GerAB/ArcD/ProY family transporter [Paenibacillus sp. HJGM_3]|uniref:GerAB/ArcD/ProY family transporter n=1 Tax=Paenibacillus sp. HJGM_3 TaxID=3379816 RepID=UPI0038596D0E
MNITITRSQLFFLIVKTQIGIGLLSLPSKTQSTAKGDAWISVLVAGAVIQLLLLVYWHLNKRFPNHNLRQMTIRIFGSFPGKAVNLLYYGSFIAVAGYASALFIHLIQNWLLPLTPGWVLLLLFLSTSVYLALDNLRVIARFFVLSSVLLGLLILLSLATFAHGPHISNILPVGHSGVGQIFRGSENTFFTMLGFEVILYFFAQVEGNPAGLLKIVTLSNGFVTLFNAYFVFICLIGFSSIAIEQVNEPVIFLFKGLPNPLFDRLDLIFLTIWSIPMTTTIVAYLCLAGKSVTKSQSAYRRMVWISGALVFALGAFLSTLENLDVFGKWMEYEYLFMIAALPLLMWLISFLIKNDDRRGTA